MGCVVAYLGIVLEAAMRIAPDAARTLRPVDWAGAIDQLEIVCHGVSIADVFDATADDVTR